MESFPLFRYCEEKNILFYILVDMSHKFFILYQHNEILKADTYLPLGFLKMMYILLCHTPKNF